jgi:uncharacterized protein (TIGR02757 family)
MFNLMGEKPYDYIMNKNYQAIKLSGRGSSIHRTFFEDDFVYYCKGLRWCITQYGSLEALFVSASGVWEGIELFRKTMAEGNSNNTADTNTQLLYNKHIAGTSKGSACKKINLALRWLVRNEGPVDLGIWNNFAPSSLFIPLDVHTGRAARHLGLLDKNLKTNNKNAVIALTKKLREICPDDPVKYDLALFSYSVAENTFPLR